MKLRSIDKDDIDQIVYIHERAFDGFLMTQLGSPFLKKYYEIAASYPKNITAIKEIENQKIIGFAIGFMNPEEFYPQLVEKKFTLMKKAFRYLILRPWLWKRVLESYLFAGSDYYERKSSDSVAELASIAVLPEYKGRGAGKELITYFINQAKAKNINMITLTTDAENNDEVNLFYQRNGFILSRAFEKSKGRLVNEYVYYIRLENEG